MRFSATRVDSISTHAPRTGSDLTYQPETRWQIDFNPRSPHGERLFFSLVSISANEISTHAPRTGSDGAFGVIQIVGIAISTHAPRTGSDRCPAPRKRTARTISTHAPRTGSDQRRPSSHTSPRFDFNPRSPHGERLRVPVPAASTPRVFQPTLPARGATPADGQGCRRHTNFNPRSPHGERPRGRLLIRRRSGISTHAPRTGSDPGFTRRFP